ncbi:F-box domain containing protein [Tanacetum coccineum]|uniref:F-box domain containing protein n=1 Tax=Tanacetum coccineum TaxID=301880 RepID=A0ABQ5HY40_9ASTR
MKEEFPDWFGSQIRQRHVDNDKDPEVSTTSELFALACGPTWTPISINSCVVDGVRYVQGKTSNCKGWAFEVACGSAKPKTGSALKASGWLSSLFKQICSATLMEDDMLKAQIKVVDILCDLELIYPPALFDIMIHLVIHLPLEALEGGPIRPRSYYFRDVTTKFNHLDRNVDPLPLTCQFQVFRSVCKSIGLRSFILFDAQELKKVKWYVLHNSPEIDTYRSPVQSLFLTRHEEEFPDWLGLRDPFNVTKLLRSRRCELQEILEFKYLLFKVVLFRVKWFDTRNQGRKVKPLLPEDKAKPHLKVVKHVNHKKFSNGGVIVVEDDPDIIHFDNSSDLPLSTSLNDLDNATLHIDGQSTEVDAPPDIIDVVDEDDDIIDDEDALPHDLADFDDEDLINVDDDGVDKMSADVARSHGGDGGGEDRPPPHHVPTGCGGCFANRGKGKRKPNLGGRAAGRLHTRDKTRNLSLKEITDKKGPVPIRFEVPKERKAALITDIGTQFDLRPHMESPDWTEIDAGIQQHLQKAYNTNKAAFKAQHWVIDPETGTYNVEKIRRARPEAITAEEWDKYIQFWNDPRNISRAAQNRENRAKSTVISRQGSRSLARLRDEMRQSSATQEYPSLIDTFFVAHTVNGVFTRDEDRLIYEEMRRLEATGTYTDDEINRLARRGKQRGHIPGVGRVLPARATASPKFESGGANRSGGCGDDEESADDQEDEDGDGDGDNFDLSTYKEYYPQRHVAGDNTQLTNYRNYLISTRTFHSDMSSGNMCHRCTNYLTEKYVGLTVSLGIVAEERIPGEHSPVKIPQRQVARERYPQRQVARESPEMSLGNVVNVVVVNNILTRLSRWKLKTLSIGGRLTLLKYVLGSLPIFHMSLFKRKVMNKMESIRCHFFNGVEHNGNKQIWVKWSKVLASKENGGLGVSSFYALNRALLFKWVWRFRTQQSSIWTKVIQGIHGVDDSSSKRWFGRVLIQSAYEEYGRSIPSDMKDRWSWALSGCGDFSVASIRKSLDNRFLPVVASKTRWIHEVPIKVNILAWKVRMDSLPTRLNISKRGMDIESILCPICDKEVESTRHIFFTCHMAREIFRKILRWWDINVTEVSSYEEWLDWLLNIRLHSKHKNLLEGVCYVMWWYIWNFRNKFIFGSVRPLKEIIFDEVVARSYLWCTNRCSSSFNWVDWLKNPHLVSL